MNILVLKLPALEQVKYAEYITSVTVEADESSRWDKFWTWLKQRHKAAVQSGLMHMCNKPSSEKTSGSSVKSGVTCRTCGGIGHFARSCPSSQKSGSSPLVKVNIAVTKINTKAEYDQHIVEMRKQVGSCPVCKQGPHSYTRDFPFGKAEWPSNRLDSCPRFVAMSPKDRGKLVEKLTISAPAGSTKVLHVTRGASRIAMFYLLARLVVVSITSYCMVLAWRIVTRCM